MLYNQAFVVAGFVLYCTSFIFAGTLAISGTIKTTANKPIRAALTIHDVSTARTQGHTPFDRQFASKTDGSFTISGVPAGKYQICVDAPQENVLDPCVWSSTVNVVDLTSGAPVSGLALKVDTGYMLQVHVNDPQAALPAPKGGTAGAALSLLVITKNNRYQSLRLLGASAAAQDHYLLVPYDETMTLAVSSSSVALSDANGQRYSGDSVKVPVRIPSGKSVAVAPVVVNVGKR